MNNNCLFKRLERLVDVVLNAVSTG